MVTGLLDPSGGSVALNGRNIHDDLVAYKARLGYVPEEAQLYTWMSGAEYLTLCARLRSLPAEIVERRIDALLSIFDWHRLARRGDVRRRHWHPAARGLCGVRNTRHPGLPDQSSGGVADRLICCGMSTTPKPGTITWQDLTVGDAEALRDFYAAVVGWTPEPVKMGDYADFTMKAEAEPVAGICHARGSNSGLPPQWLVYITVDDLDHSIDECIRLGGAMIAAPRGLAGGRFCVIRDPAGAVCALYQPPDAA